MLYEQFSIAEHDPEFAVKTLQNLIKKYSKKQIDHFKRAIEKCKEKGKEEELPELEEKLNLLSKVDKMNLMNKLLIFVYKLEENDEKIPEENKPKDDEEQNKIINIFLTETKIKNDIEKSLLKPSEVPRDKNLQTKYEYISKLKEKIKIKQLQSEMQGNNRNKDYRNKNQYILDGMGSSSIDDRRKAARLLKDKMINKKEYPMRRKKSDYNEDGTLKEKAIKRERERSREVENERDEEKGYENRKKRRMNQNENGSFNRNNNNKSNSKRKFNNDNKKPDQKENKQIKAKTEDISELHPSWAAAKIAKQKQKLKIDLNAAPQSKKIVFE